MLHLILKFAAPLGGIAGFYVGAWARGRYKSPWTKVAFFFMGWIAGFLVAFQLGFITVMVIANLTGLVDFSHGTVDAAGIRALAGPLGAKKIDFATTAAIGTLLGLFTPFGEQLGIGRSRAKQ